MNRDSEALRDLVFTHPETKEQYGTMRPRDGVADHPAASGDAEVFAEDDCGNVFIVLSNGVVVFWDHETNATTELAPNWSAFSQHCAKPEPVEFDQSQVKSAWIDPEFAKELGLDVPPDGWTKKP